MNVGMLITFIVAVGILWIIISTIRANQKKIKQDQEDNYELLEFRINPVSPTNIVIERNWKIEKDWNKCYSSEYYKTIEEAENDFVRVVTPESKIFNHKKL